GVESLLREAVLDGVERALRLGTGEAEAFVGSPADRTVEHEDRSGDDQPACDHAPGVTSGEVPDPVEEVRHGDAFRMMCEKLSWTSRTVSSKVGTRGLPPHGVGRTAHGADRAADRRPGVRKTARQGTVL